LAAGRLSTYQNLAGVETFMSQPYTRRFFAHHNDGAHRSAVVILPIVFKHAAIKSIVDFGCGTGTWLRCASDTGVSDIQGLDGEWVVTDDLCIAPHQFRRTDLTKPVTLDRKYDLAICLEVAEHLPASSAGTLVDSITQASDLILFSAAIPNQGGTHHINEQWQDYWVALFGQRGFAVSDIVRPAIWGRPDVEWWYQQNTLLFAKGGEPHLNRSLNMVHPQLLPQLDLFPSNPSGRQSLRMLKAGAKGLGRCAVRKVTATAARVYKGSQGEPG
jgi:hypothetical protein